MIDYATREMVLKISGILHKLIKVRFHIGVTFDPLNFAYKYIMTLQDEFKIAVILDIYDLINSNYTEDEFATFIAKEMYDEFLEVYSK